MDLIAGFLDGPRAKGAFLLRVMMKPPFALRIQDESPLTVVSMVKGTLCIEFDDGSRETLGAGDVAVLRGLVPFVASDDWGTPPMVVIHPGNVPKTPGGMLIEQGMNIGVRTWGNNVEGEESADAMTMLVGAYQTEGEVSQRLISTLPNAIVIKAESWQSPFVPLLAGEVPKDDAGQEVVLDRLLDLLLVAALREFFAREDASVPRWYNAYGDPVVGRALRNINNNPAHPWTVQSLASDAGVSRAALARRFNDLVGETPMAFLTGWRMALAADLLLEDGASVGGVSAKVGYTSQFTFSTAFKRIYGLGPRAFRDQRLAARA